MAVRLSKSCILLIVVAGVERFVYKGVASNLVTYLTTVLNMSTSSAAKSVSTWTGVTSLLTLICAVLSDSYWDRYSTIAASSFLYAVGLIGLTIWAVKLAWMPTFTLFIPLYLISGGLAGYNPSLQAFGADQLELEDELPCCQNDEKTSKKKSLFFQWWYFGICSGSLLGNSCMSYIQDTLGWGIGFAIPTLAMMLSIVCLKFCARCFVHSKNSNSRRDSSESILKSTKIAVKNTFCNKICLPSREEDGGEIELQEKPLKDDFNNTKNASNNSIQIEEQQQSVAKVILNLFPIWLMLLMFAVIFQQPPTFFLKQGMAMRHTIAHNIIFPPAMLQSSITISVILLMPVYDKLIIPVLRLITGNEKGINVFQRMGIGMVLSVLAMVIAAIVETKRLNLSRSGSENMSILWLLPQYMLLGASDVFTVVGIQEFFYSQVPSSMKTIGIALYLSVFGFGSFLSALLISVVELVTGSSGENKSWFSDDMNEARLDKYYWFLAILSLASFFMFMSLCRFYDNCKKDNTGNQGYKKDNTGNQG